MEFEHDNNEVDNFKPLFKYYKQKQCLPRFDDCLDLYQAETEKRKNFYKYVPPSNASDLGLKESVWNIYSIEEIPGLYFIKNPFSEEGQRYWCNQCLKSYCCSPHKTNVKCKSSNYMDLSDKNDDIWTITKQNLEVSSYKKITKKEQLDILKKSPIWKLRWATLGYHHNWDTKVYSKENRSDFPGDLNKLSNIFAQAIGWEGFVGQAAIVNFYHVGSTLSPHTDTSETNLRLPLISISFGLPAIFLIGGPTKRQRPLPIVIRSGDALVMSGESRLAYHAVPRIMERDDDGDIADPLQLFLSHSRVNINVRQVDDAVAL